MGFAFSLPASTFVLTWKIPTLMTDFVIFVWNYYLSQLAFLQHNLLILNNWNYNLSQLAT